MSQAALPFPDREARRLIAESLDESLIVEAAAGTGKTSELIGRLVAVLREGKTTVDRIVAVTFTRKAAGELKLRLRQKIDQARNEANQSAAGRQNLTAALAKLEEAQIGTIHSFCADLLRQRPVEACIDPDFIELAESEDVTFFQRVFSRWIQEKLDRPGPALARVLCRPPLPAFGENPTPVEALAEAGFRLAEWRDLSAPWARPAFSLAAEIDRLVGPLLLLADLLPRANDPQDALLTSLAPVSSLAGSIRRAEMGAQPRDYAAIEGRLAALLASLRKKGRIGRTKEFAPGVLRAEVLAARDALTNLLSKFLRLADSDLAAALKDELSELVDRYQAEKRKAGKLDFLDLLIFTRDLIRDHDDVRRELQQRFSHLFVDEFQDTDPLQAEILLLLSADDPKERNWRNVCPAGGKLFLVGDPKQSIYRFRRADLSFYRAVNAALFARGVRILELSSSFRAVSPIQEAINTAFSPEMSAGAPGQVGYVPLGAGPSAEPSQPSVIALPIPYPFYGDRVSNRAIDGLEPAGKGGLPQVVGGFLQWLLEDSGWTIRDPDQEGARLPIAPRHVAILFRRFKEFERDVTLKYVEQLERRGIMHLLVGSRSFHQREEVETLRAALTAIEYPEDELSVYATLRGALFALPDALLLRYQKTVAPLHPFSSPVVTPAAELMPVAEGLAFLAELHRARNARPFVETISALLEHTRAHAGFAFRPGGDQVLVNVGRVLDLARTFESRGGWSFRGLVERLTSEAERPRTTETPILEEGLEGVRLMTVHGAKGLEFPVVILADPMAGARRNPDRLLEAESGRCTMRLMGLAPHDLTERGAEELSKEHAEGTRLLYVAATRARDLLVVPALGTEAWEPNLWLAPLCKALFPPDSWRRSDLAPGCPQFGEDSVLVPDPRFSLGDTHSVRPGLHRFGVGGNEVVWWDPGVLPAPKGPPVGLRREEILRTEGVPPIAADRGRALHEAWKQKRRAALQAGQIESLEPFNPSEAKNAPPGALGKIEIVKVARVNGRPGGKRFGTLVHTILSHVSYTADRDEVCRLSQVHGKGLGATPPEIKAAVEPVVATLAHPLVLRARRADACHRELTILLDVENDGVVEGTMLEGAVDLAFREGNLWTVIDFKTDHELTEHKDQYQRQVQWYVFGLSRITGLEARGILLAI